MNMGTTCSVLTKSFNFSSHMRSLPFGEQMAFFYEPDLWLANGI